jgi:hypothetical protein
MEYDHLNCIGAVIGRRRREIGGTNINWIYITIVIRVHMAVGKKAIREQR